MYSQILFLLKLATELIGVFMTQICVLVEGRYIVEVRLNGYTNPSGKCNSDDCFTWNGRHRTCCDSHNTNMCTGWERCDSYFIYCLIPLGEVNNNYLGCFDDDVKTVSHSNRDDGYIDFSLSRVLGLSNPQNFSGLRDAYEVSY